MSVHGVIAAGSPQSAAAGAAVLRGGGRAADAAVATAFAAFVAELPLASPAGSGVALVGNPGEGFSALDFFSVHPGMGLARQRREDLDFHVVTVDFGATTQDFHVGRGAAAVPTALFGLLELHRRFGSVPLSKLLEPAIRLAREGCEMSQQVCWIIELLRPIMTMNDMVRGLHGDGQGLVCAGEKLTNPALAGFLEALAYDGESLLRGAFTDAVLDAFGPERGGLLTRSDLQGYTPRWLEPLRVPFRGLDVLTMPPPSSGGALVGLGLRLAEHLDLQGAAFLSASHLQQVASLLATVDRARGTGFDELINRPESVSDLLTDEAVERVRRDHREATSESPLGSTTHISVLDEHGGAVSITLTNGEGCGHVLPEFGIHMNNFLGELDINPGGFHSEPAGAPMATMMAPTVVLREQEPQLVLGSGGSNRIRSAILQAMVAALVFERPIM